MRDVVASVFVSLDGVMQAPGAPEEDPSGGFALGGWSVDYWDEGMSRAIGEAMTGSFDLVLGRKTYDIFAAHWPRVDGDPVGESFTRATKHVATSSPETLGWANSRALDGDVASAVESLKREDGPELLIQGSSQLIQALLARGLIDEFRLWVFPVVLGSGKRLFGGGAAPGSLRLVSSETSTTGVAMSVYRRDGAIKIGSFALEQPTEEELARRRSLEPAG